MDIIASELGDVLSGQNKSEEAVKELMDRIEQLAEKMLSRDNELRESLVKDLREKTKDMARMRTEHVLWDMAKVVIRVLTGIPIF